MIKYFKIFSVFILATIGLSCSEDPVVIPDRPSTPEEKEEWSVPEHRLFNGGPGRDGIPSIDNPKFISIEEADSYTANESLHAVLKIGNDIHAYPIDIMDWHEIVNDEIGSEHIALSYCPLTGTSMAWDRHLKLGVTTFGVSGLLFNSNLIPFERETGSEWSQMLGMGIHGWYQDEPADEFPIVEMTWENLKLAFPTVKVMSRNTGFERPYDLYPYDDYKDISARLLFPIVPLDERLHLKERVHGIIVNNKARVYRFNLFKDETKIIVDNFEGEEIIVIGNQAQNFIVSYKNELPDGSKIIPSVDTSSAYSFKDNLGNTWNQFGESVSGPNKGQNLTAIRSLMGYWMSFSSFYPNPVIEGL